MPEEGGEAEDVVVADDMVDGDAVEDVLGLLVLVEEHDGALARDGV